MCMDIEMYMHMHMDMQYHAYNLDQLIYYCWKSSILNTIAKDKLGI